MRICFSSSRVSIREARCEEDQVNKLLEKVETGKVYCPMCTHTVDAEIQRVVGRRARRSAVKPGQRFSHCSAPLDAGYIFEVRRAA